MPFGLALLYCTTVSPCPGEYPRTPWDEVVRLTPHHHARDDRVVARVFLRVGQPGRSSESEGRTARSFFRV